MSPLVLCNNDLQCGTLFTANVYIGVCVCVHECMGVYSMLSHVDISDYMTPFHVSSDRLWLVDMEYCGVKDMTLMITSGNLQVCK